MRLSIITINYNDAKGLQTTLESVKNQVWQDFEHVVIDGNSSDGSKTIIESYNYKDLVWVSEPDTGIYNAMNKGIAMAQGKYLLFLNSGDYLHNDQVLKNVNTYFDSDISFLCGTMYYENNNKRTKREHPEVLSFSYLVSKTISHPSTFIIKSMFTKYGTYNESLKIASDWEFFLKCLGLNGESYKKLDEAITVFNMDGISSNEDNFKLVEDEKRKILKSYLPTVYSNYNDTYIFNHFKQTSKRFKYLKVIDNSPFFRKLATLMLMINHRFLKIVKRLGL
ncbi:glycosyltransferase family 2 protein [uncultured Winogradskyella sp.]|uniref:glycosyltransferase family 2 protein n=1 Tax=uncultured Winogradskyella sp. TaxID=395353 RepID=UPI00260FD179|nr:glycosyltransferase family 2 protein [uncultured Winogradskyella sp.]